ncbi:hypothetical protein M9Y10_038939 [Tritrichomonas musculus]|uniref:Clathrin/coatomer adaptor adaptin-like N-terminal domain-containing protein n=1 Tax=Tritrichomonas musculus TaxID=1915356 RepID=A0ABR2K9T2_9EUKA
MKSHKTDFQAFENGNGRSLYDFLDDVPGNLNEKTIDRFYNSSINLLNNESTSITIKYKIIYSLVKSLSSQAHIESFINGNYLTKLPFKLFNIQEKILDIIFIIATYAPNGITNEIAIKFGHLITRYPRKCLTILSIFAERFQITFNPWKMIDLLFKYCDTFIESECVDDFISILSYLNTNFQCFREARLKHTWFAYSQIINKSELDCSKSIGYYAMCQLYEIRPRIVKKLPLPDSIPNDLLNPHLQKAAVSLLLRCSSNQDAEPIIKSLLKIKNEDCFRALSILVENPECANILSNDLSWLQEEIPTIEGTMKIFAKLIKSARYDLVKSPEVVTFLNSIVNNGQDPETVSDQSLIAASTFVRSLPVNNKFVGYLSKEDFLLNYFNAALQRTEKPVIDSTILLIDTIAKRGDVVELSDVCDFIKDNVINNNDPTALKTAVDLALYPRCAKEFQKNGLAEYFEKDLNLPNSSSFLSNYRKSIKRPVKAPPVVSSLPPKKSSNSFSQQKQSPVKKPDQLQKKDQEEIKTRNISIPVKKVEKVPLSESKTVAGSKAVPESKPVSDPKPASQSKPAPVPTHISEPESESDPELESDTNSCIKTTNDDDEILLPENSSDDSSIAKEDYKQKPSSLQSTAPSSPSVASSVVSSPSASGVYDPYIAPNSQVRSSPIALSKISNDESESLSNENQNDSDNSESFKSSILKNHAPASDEDSSASETENINPSLSPIKQRSIIPASPLNRSKIRSIGSIGSASDDSEIKKSSSLISIDLPPPEQNTQNLLPDAFGGLTYIKQGSPPPKPRPSRNKE